MSKRMDGPADAGLGHNQMTQDDRQALLQTAIELQIAIDRERDTFNSTMRERRNREVVAKVKGSLGLPLGQFAFLVKLKKQQDDPDNEEQWLLTKRVLAEGFAALEIGSQGDMLKAMGVKAIEDVAADSKSKAKELAKGKTKAKAPAKKGKAAAEAKTPENPEEPDDTIEQAADKGFEAGAEAKVNMDDNPYPIGTKNNQAWAAQYRAAQANNAREIGQAPTAH